jgi:hypothetical protein
MVSKEDREEDEEEDEGNSSILSGKREGDILRTASCRERNGDRENGA